MQIHRKLTSQTTEDAKRTPYEHCSDLLQVFSILHAISIITKLPEQQNTIIYYYLTEVQLTLLMA